MTSRRTLLRGLLAVPAASALPAAAAGASRLTPEALAARLAPKGVLEGRFTQTRTLEGFPKPLISEGRFVFAPGRGVLWSTEKPFPSELVLTREALSATNAFGTETLSASAVPQIEAVGRLVTALVSGRFDVLADSFSMTLEGSLERWRAELLPAGGMPSRLFSRILAEGGEHPERITLLTADGQRTCVTLSGQRIIDAVPPALQLRGQ